MADLTGSSTSTTSTSSVGLSDFEKAQLTQLESLNYSINQFIQEEQMTATYNPATDYSFISALLLLAIFILSFFKFLRDFSTKQ